MCGIVDSQKEINAILVGLQKMSQSVCSREDNSTLYKLITVRSIASLKHVLYFSGKRSTYNQDVSAYYFLSYAKERTLS